MTVVRGLDSTAGHRASLGLGETEPLGFHADLEKKRKIIRERVSLFLGREGKQKKIMSLIIMHVYDAIMKFYESRIFLRICNVRYIKSFDH